ncbi:hypothetical protein [Sphingobacterium alkalisoli]|nr:hypothetical protein [Sphingobacterium alkalisoli]
MTQFKNSFIANHHGLTGAVLPLETRNLKNSREQDVGILLPAEKLPEIVR